MNGRLTVRVICSICVAVVIGCSAIAFGRVQSVDYTGKPPYPKDQLIRIIRLKSLPRGDIETAVANRGVGFRVDQAVRKELAQAGAWPELIGEISVSYRPDAARRIVGDDFEGSTYSPFCAVPRLQTEDMVTLIESGVTEEGFCNLVRIYGVTVPKDRDPGFLRYHGATNKQVGAVIDAEALPEPTLQNNDACGGSGPRPTFPGLKEYQRVKAGMTYFDLLQVFGRTGYSYSQDKWASNGYRFVRYLWGNDSTGRIYVVLRDGRVVIWWHEGLR